MKPEESKYSPRTIERAVAHPRHACKPIQELRDRTVSLRLVKIHDARLTIIAFLSTKRRVNVNLQAILASCTSSVTNCGLSATQISHLRQ